MRPATASGIGCSRRSRRAVSEASGSCQENDDPPGPSCAPGGIRTTAPPRSHSVGPVHRGQRPFRLLPAAEALPHSTFRSKDQTTATAGPLVGGRRWRGRCGWCRCGWCRCGWCRGRRQDGRRGLQHPDRRCRLHSLSRRSSSNTLSRRSSSNTLSRRSSSNRLGRSRSRCSRRKLCTRKNCRCRRCCTCCRCRRYCNRRRSSSRNCSSRKSCSRSSHDGAKQTPSRWLPSRPRPRPPESEVVAAFHVLPFEGSVDEALGLAQRHRQATAGSLPDAAGRVKCVRVRPAGNRSARVLVETDIPRSRAKSIGGKPVQSARGPDADGAVKQIQTPKSCQRQSLRAALDCLLMARTCRG